MSPAGEGPVPYQLIYSERVRNALRELLERARARGIGGQVLDAVKAIDARLRVPPPRLSWPAAIGPCIGTTRLCLPIPPSEAAWPGRRGWPGRWTWPAH